VPRPTPSAQTIHQLWDDLAGFDASRTEEALDHALTVLASLVDAQNAFWLGAVCLAPGRVPDPLRGWRPRAIRYLHPHDPDLRFYQRARRDLDAGEVDESTVANVRGAGTFRAHLLRDLVSPAWFTSPFYDIAYRALDVIDAVFVISPVNRDAESYFGFQRKVGHRRFAPRDRDLLATALRGLKWFHQQVLLSHGLLVARAPLGAMERRVLRLLLTPLSEKEIAGRLGVTPGTAHGYITAILRKFGVSGRTGLTALWLGHQPALTSVSPPD
jgi:DNA-binding CsgD family transcriptional regulator